MKIQKKSKYKILFYHSIPVLLFLVLLHGPIKIEGRERDISISDLEDVIQRINPKLGENRKQYILNCAKNPPIGCSKVEKILIINEILLRDQFKGLHKPCTDTEHHEIPIIHPDIGAISEYDAPPNFVPTEKGLEEPTRNYTKWVDKMIDSGTIFCDPFKYVYCSKQKKCTCLPGLIEINGVCAGPVGSYCYYIYKFYFKDLYDGMESPFRKKPGMSSYDPFEFISHQIPKELIDDNVCPNNIFPFNYHCERSNYFPLNPVCTDPMLRNITPDLDIYFKQLLPRLGFSDTCNFKKHIDLYTISKEEELNPGIRMKTIQLIKENKNSFCDLRKLLTCSPISSKCECIEHTTYDTTKGLCTTKSQTDVCKYLYNGPDNMETNYSLIPLARDDFKIGRNDQPFLCKKNFICTELYDEISYCSCPPDLAGKNCDETLTRFINIIKPTTFAKDILDYDKKFELFNQLNKVGVIFDAKFKLENGSQCNFNAEREAYLKAIPIKMLDIPNTAMVEVDYIKLIKSITSSTSYGEFCNIFHTGSWEPPKSRPKYKCSFPNSPNEHGICYETTNDGHAKDLIKILKSHQTLKLGEFCPPDLPNNPYLYGYQNFFNTFEKHWALNTQFCNKTAGLICKNSNIPTNLGTCSPPPPPTTLPPSLPQKSLGCTAWPEYGSVWKSNDILIECFWILLFTNMFH